MYRFMRDESNHIAYHIILLDQIDIMFPSSFSLQFSETNFNSSNISGEKVVLDILLGFFLTFQNSLTCSNPANK